MIKRRSAALLTGLFACSVLALAGTPDGQYAADLVDQDSYQFTLDEMLYTRSGDNRGIGGPEHDLCRDAIYDAFELDGLTTTLHAFTYDNQTYYNVVGELTGTTRPSEVYIIGAHYDSVNNPGADDNASGVAALIEISRLIGGWQSDATIRLIGFDREEQGLHGSHAYASDYINDDIRGMVSLDMIAYSGGAKFRTGARIYGRAANDAHKTALRNALREYVGITPALYDALDASDHAPFGQRGFPACLLIELNVFSNPNYHQPEDSVDTPNYIDYVYARNMTAGTLGWLVDAAGVQVERLIGDLNCDAVVDTYDIDPFVLALTDEAAYAAAFPDCQLGLADCDGDGAVDTYDIDAFVEAINGS